MVFSKCSASPPSSPHWYGWARRAAPPTEYRRASASFWATYHSPVYIVHYPLYYLFYAWLIKNRYYTFGETWLVALCLIIANVVLAYVCLKCYDEPVRRWLAKRFLKK